MPSISIFGAGKMGTAVGGIAVRSGAEVQIIAPVLGEAAATASVLGATAATVGDPLTGDIVIFAVPYSAIAQILATYAGELADKIVVDVTNPVDYTTFDSLVVPPDGSAAQQIAEAVPAARVLKAFNTTFAGTLTSGLTGETPTTVLVAGDDQAAKDALIGVIEGGGLRAMDVGSLRRARELEAIGFLQSTLAASGKITWAGGFVVTA